MELMVNLAGRISAVSRDGRSCVIHLDQPYANKRLAVVSPETKGRISLMSRSRDGKLAKNTRVRVVHVEVGSEALRALEIGIE